MKLSVCLVVLLSLAKILIKSKYIMNLERRIVCEDLRCL